MLGLNQMHADRVVVEHMTTSMRTGTGRDGIYMAGPVGLGFRRLSILDLSHAADQPMASDDGQLIWSSMVKSITMSNCAASSNPSVTGLSQPEILRSCSILTVNGSGMPGKAQRHVGLRHL